MYCLPNNHQIFVPDEIKNDKQVRFQYGLPEFERFSGKEPHLIIIDDMMDSIDSNIMNLFTKFSHHRNLSTIIQVNVLYFLSFQHFLNVVFLLKVQNVFFTANKFFRTLSLNCSSICLMKNPR